MERVAKFEKVSLKTFADVPDAQSEALWEKITLPKRGTKGSAGYDFVTPTDIVIKAGESVLVKTGIKAKIKEGWVLNAYPRSSVGTKLNISLKNTVGIIDSDYYNNEKNEGHIMFYLKNNGTSDVIIPAGNGYVQGMFVPFGITEDDDVAEERKGGFGSTTK